MGVDAAGLPGVGFTTNVNTRALPVQVAVAGITLTLVVTTFWELFKALNPPPIFPEPVIPNPTLVGVDQLKLVLGVSLENVIGEPVAPAHRVTLETALAEGVGLTVMVNVLAGPAQELAEGLTVTDAVAVVVTGFVTVKPAILPFPPVPNPTLPLLVQINVVPEVGLLKLIGAPEADPQYVMFPIEVTTGVGLTVTVKGRTGPVQVAVLGVTFTVLIIMAEPALVAV